MKLKICLSGLVLAILSTESVLAGEGGSILGHNTSEPIIYITKSLERRGYLFRKENISFKADPSRKFLNYLISNTPSGDLTSPELSHEEITIVSDKNLDMPRPAIFDRNIVYKDAMRPTFETFQIALTDVMGGEPSYTFTDKPEPSYTYVNGRIATGKERLVRTYYTYRWKDGDLKKSKPFSETLKCATKGVKPSKPYGGKNLFSSKPKKGYRYFSEKCGKMAFVSIAVVEGRNLVSSARVTLMDNGQIAASNNLFEDWLSQASENFNIEEAQRKKAIRDSLPTPKL